MAADFTAMQNDTGPALTATLADSSGTAVNLAGATVRFVMTQRGATTPKVDAAATVLDEAAGEVSYEWVAADTDTHGTFHGSFEVTFADGSIQTFPNSRYLNIQVLRDLG